MPAHTQHVTNPSFLLLLLLFTTFYVIPDLVASSRAQATSLELKLSSDLTDDDIRLVEDHARVVHFNYVLNVTGDANHTLALAVCVTVDDPTIATATVSEDTIVPLQEDVQGAFNVTVAAHFVGRAYLHMHFVVGQNKHVRCGQPEAKNLQDLLKVSEASQGRGMDMNVTKSSGQNSSSSAPSSKVVGVHSGRRYKIVVFRPERAIDVVFQVGVVVLVVIINVGMGCKLDLQVVKATLKRPFAPVTGLLSQFLIMPLASFGVTQIFDLTPGVALGFFALGCSPGGSASNAYCYLLGGDVSLSITMTFVSTVASIGLLPMWMFTLGRYVSKMEEITIPFANIIYSLLGLMAAVGVGLILKYKKPAWARVVIAITKVCLVIFILFMLTVGIYANLYMFSLMKGVVLAAAAALPYTGFLLGGLAALAVRMPAKNVITIAVETGIQNTGVAIIVLMLSLDHPESDLSIVAPATSALFTPIPLWIAIIIFKLRRCYTRRKHASEDKPTTTATTTTTTATATESDAATTNPENQTPQSPKENLCEKLFGIEGPGAPTCWRRPCLYCLCDLDKEAQTPKDVDIVIPDPKTQASEGPVPKKKESYEFDNLAFEDSAADRSKTDRSNGRVPREGGERSRKNSETDSCASVKSIKDSNVSDTVC